MNRIRHRLLNPLRQPFLQCLRHLGVARSVADLAGFLVAAGVVKSVRDLLFDVFGDLVGLLVYCSDGGGYWGDGGAGGGGDELLPVPCRGAGSLLRGRHLGLCRWWTCWRVEGGL